MYDKSTSNNNKKSVDDKQYLLLEKRKAISHCTNLEFKKEQLNTLIQKLYQLSVKRKIFNCSGQDHLYVNNSNLSYELKMAKESSLELEREILEMRGKIVEIDEALSE